MMNTNRQMNADADDDAAATSSVGDVIMATTTTTTTTNHHESTSSPANPPPPPQTAKRRVEEIHQAPPPSSNRSILSHENGTSGNNNEETIIATKFHDDDNNNNNNNNNNVDNNNSYFCIGSGSGCLNRSTSANCLTRELEQFPKSTQEHVGQDLYGLTEKCIPTVDTHLLEELEKAIVALIEKADAEHHSEALRRRTEEATMATATNDQIGNNSSDTDTDHVDIPYYAYRLAVSKSSSYVHQSQFRLMFLRCTEGNVKKAAKRTLRHFKTKLQLFGEDKLVRDIVLDDLNENDMESLLSGGFQVLKDRDAAGRSVLFGRYTSMKYRTIDNMLRALWYIWMSILEDPINQMKGVVAVGYEVGKVPLDKFNCTNGTEEDSEEEEIEEDDDNNNNGISGEDDDIDFTSSSGTGGFEMSYADDNNSGGFDREMAREIISIPLSVPVRPAGYHLCTDSHQWVGILNTVLVTMCKLVRLRMRIHHGSDQECKYVLMTHGISSDSIPVDDTGYMSLTNHIEWIEQRRLSDANKL